MSIIQTDQSTQEKPVIFWPGELYRQHWYLMRRARLEASIPCCLICAYSLRVSHGRIQSPLISHELYHLKSILFLWFTYIFFMISLYKTHFNSPCLPRMIGWCSLFEKFDCVLLCLCLFLFKHQKDDNFYSSTWCTCIIWLMVTVSEQFLLENYTKTLISYKRESCSKSLILTMRNI